MSEPETIRRTILVKIADADGKAIREGSVLEHITDGVRGVVDWVGREGVTSGPPMAALGDISIQTSHGSHRVTNCYSEWRHIPHDLQTYIERLRAWLHLTYDHDEERGVSRDEALAIDGIMALLPADTQDWERGDTADRLEDALEFLVDHLAELQKQIPTRPNG